MQVLLGNLEGTAQPKCQKDTVNAESVLKALPMLFSAEVLDYFEFLGRFLLLNPNLLVFSFKSQPVVWQPDQISPGLTSHNVSHRVCGTEG